MGADSEASSFSLRKRVAWGLLVPLAIILVINAGWSYKSALDAANRAYDRSLTASLKSLAESIHATAGEISVDIPYSALEIFEEGVQERVYYAVIGYGGRRITGYTDLYPPVSVAADDDSLVVDVYYREQPVRMAALAKRLYDPELAGGDTVTILFAETTGARLRLANSLFMDTLRPQLLLLGVGFLLVVIVLKGAFRPLLELRDTIRQRKEEDLTPVSQSNVPNELMPLIDAINFHMARLDRLLQARRRFLADAAHQIRTPLTVLGAQAEYGQRQSHVDEMRSTFGSLIETIRGTRRMANQMLTLARAEPASGASYDFSPMDFSELVCDVAGELATLAQKKAIDLSFEGAERPALVDGNATMLREMVSNVVDNALRYTQAGGHVTLSITSGEDSVMLRVVDDGPGIPEVEREKVFERFYRVLGQGDSGGSGLGLAIVREICWAHSGKVALGSAADDRGLAVTITLPVAHRGA